MTTTTWTSAPAGFVRPRGLDVRPGFGGTAVGRAAMRASGPVVLVEGTGVSAAGIAALNEQVITEQAITEQKYTALTHPTGTPLGIPSSRRPLS